MGGVWSKMEVKGKIIILCQCCWPRSKSIPAYFHPLYVLTTGYRRLASIISPETQSPSKGQLQQKSTPPCFCHFDSSPVCKGWRQSLKAKHSKLLEMTLSIPLLTLTSAFYKGRWNRHERMGKEGRRTFLSKITPHFNEDNLKQGEHGNKTGQGI